jgi:Holliday junction resolvase
LGERRLANKNRNKGIYHEKWFETWLKKIGINVKRQPMSGALGGEYIGDLVINHNGKKFNCEVKYRDKSKFPNPFSLFKNKDLVLFKRRTKPKDESGVLIIFTQESFEKFMEK